MSHLQKLISCITYSFCHKFDESFRLSKVNCNDVFLFVMSQLNQSPSHVKLVVVISTWTLYILSFFKSSKGMLKMNNQTRLIFLSSKRSSLLTPLSKCIQFYESLVVLKCVELKEKGFLV